MINEVETLCEIGLSAWLTTRDCTIAAVESVKAREMMIQATLLFIAST
jgi:hypothetical protein